MTLVQNHPRLLNGNSMISTLFCFLVFFGCGTLQPVPTTTPEEISTEEITKVKVYNPSTGQYEEVSVVQQPMDTMKFDVVEEDIVPPITDQSTPEILEGEFVEDKRDSYNVSMLLPFVSDSPASPGMQVNRKSMIAIQFYAGAQLALERLTEEGVNVNLSVFDTKAESGQVKYILDKGEVLNADLIIGPYRNASVKVAADFAKQYEKPVVSPFTPHERITSDNPFFIQMNPGLKSHMRAILGHITQQHSADQITLVALDNGTERKRLQQFQQVHREMSGSNDVEPLNEFIITRDIADEETLPIDTTLFAEGRKAIYVFPSWSRERQIYEFLRKLNLAKGSEKELMVYGMPQWQKFDYYDYYERLNVHLTSAVFLDRYDRRVTSFKTKYLDRYSDLPDENAYLGYDTMLYFGRQLSEKGVNFYRVLDQLDDNMMTCYFDFERQVHNAEAGEGKMTSFDQFENSNLNIIQFKDYRFQKAN